ncbi:MAG: thymidine phosphorylase [Clostridia bacterium]|nr:thymidine phosphorylase [Clostridia bacterium]
MKIYDIIEKKRDGHELTDEEIEFFVKGYTNGEIADYCASALLMAIFLNGMDSRETATLTRAICLSGDTVDLSRFGSNTVDKHSTGGVGDKTTLIVAPTVASLGCTVAKISGRGLGHTGGTVDKLESITGYKTSLSTEEFLSQVEKIGICVVGQSGNLAPADKKIYALRDLTATVDNVSLIASSIMGKKLAAGAHSIVLDVKCGSGAFMKTLQDAQALAEEMVEIGKRNGRNTVALITDMDTPLGSCIGNRIEVEESIKVLKNEERGELRDLCVKLSANMVALCKGVDISNAEDMVEKSLESGAAFDKFCEWISCQGGDIGFLLSDEFSKSKYSCDVYSFKEGYISKTDTEKIGKSACVLGAGRTELGGKIDFTAGIRLNKKRGDFVKAGEKIATLYSSQNDDFSQSKEIFLDAIEFSKEKPSGVPLVHKTVK